MASSDQPSDRTFILLLLIAALFLVGLALIIWKSSESGWERVDEARLLCIDKGGIWIGDSKTCAWDIYQDK